MARLKARLIYSNSLTAVNDVRYGCGFVAPDPVLLIILAKKQILVVSTMEQGRAKRECYSSVEVLTPEELLLPPKKRWDIVEQIQAVAARVGIKTVEVGFDFPAGIYTKLMEKGWKVQLSPRSNYPTRRTKNQQYRQGNRHWRHRRRYRRRNSRRRQAQAERGVAGGAAPLDPDHGRERRQGPHHRRGQPVVGADRAGRGGSVQGRGAS